MNDSGSFISVMLLTAPNTNFELVAIKIFHIVEKILVEVMSYHRFQDHCGAFVLFIKVRWRRRQQSF